MMFSCRSQVDFLASKLYRACFVGFQSVCVSYNRLYQEVNSAKSLDLQLPVCLIGYKAKHHFDWTGRHTEHPEGNA